MDFKKAKQNHGKVIIIAGMQYGSEGKGHTTSYLSLIVSAGVRTGATNAGHTIYFKNQKLELIELHNYGTDKYNNIHEMSKILSWDYPLFIQLKPKNALSCPIQLSSFLIHPQP